MDLNDYDEVSLVELGWSKPKLTLVKGRREVHRGLSHLLVRWPDGVVRARCGVSCNTFAWRPDPWIKAMAQACTRCLKPYSTNRRRLTLLAKTREGENK